MLYIVVILPQTSLDSMAWVDTYFFGHDLQVVVRQSIGEIYKCKSITDPHYRLLNLESRYTSTEILPVHNSSYIHNVTAAMLVYQDNPVGIELFSYLKTIFCSYKLV